jgi:hypothetical protein
MASRRWLRPCGGAFLRQAADGVAPSAHWTRLAGRPCSRSNAMQDRCRRQRCGSGNPFETTAPQRQKESVSQPRESIHTAHGHVIAETMIGELGMTTSTLSEDRIESVAETPRLFRRIGTVDSASSRGSSRPNAPAKWLGYQRRCRGGPAVELYILTSDIPGHPKKSTVSRPVLERAGYYVPPPPRQC